MAMTGVNHFSGCDVTDREGNLRTNEFRRLAPCLVAIAISNPMVIIHSLYGQGNSQRDHIWAWNTPLTSGQGVLPLSVDREYYVIISNKYLTYSDGSPVHQIRLNNSYHN